MDRLPDELLLLIFRYLHKFDILYSFDNLNKHFQRIIEPYSYSINFSEDTDVSYTYFLLFINDILPIYGTHIRSLTLNGYHQIQLLQPYLHHLINLESFILQSENKIEHSIYVYQFKQFITNILSLSSLSELSIFGDISELLLQTISSSTSNNLTKLILISSNGCPNLEQVLPMLTIKYLSINLRSVSRLVKLFRIMPNLEELKLSILSLQNLQNIEQLKIPKNLIKFHLEFVNYKKFGTQPSIVRIKKILYGFQNQIHSLTLIVIHALKEFSNYDEFQSLINNFTQLQIFEYYIRTNYQPNSSLFPNIQQLLDSTSYCFYTYPKPEVFDIISNRITCKYIRNSNRFVQELFECTVLEFFDEKPFQTISNYLFELGNNIKFIHLKKLRIHICMDDIKPDLCQFFSKIISLSPNLNTLDILAKNPMKIIEQLMKIYTKPTQVIHMIYREYGEIHSYSTIFYNLSKIFPYLRTFTFFYSINHVEKDSEKSIISYIPELRRYFPQLIHLKIETQRRTLLEKCKHMFKEIQQQTENNFLCFSYESGYSFHIWF